MSVQPTDERNQDGNRGVGIDTAPETPGSDKQYCYRSLYKAQKIKNQWNASRICADAFQIRWRPDSTLYM